MYLQNLSVPAGYGSFQKLALYNIFRNFPEKASKKESVIVNPKKKDSELFLF